tara:strand:+ start:389 stop:901 length:513 start_codon:yes stop_codon:yes gene_type:complete
MVATPVPTIAVFPEEKLTQSQKVEKWTWQLCRALEGDYEQYHRRMITNNAQRYSQGDNVLGVREDLSQYAKDQLEALDNGTAKLMKFRMEFGRKYIKIIQQDYDTFQDRNEYRDGSVHAFVDRNTGEVYKPASWKSPAKHVRYDLRLIRDRANLHDPNFVDWAGGYLYMR